MTGSIRIEFAPDVTDEVDRIPSHLLEYEINDAAARVQDLVAANDVLEGTPLIGRPAQGELMELVIGRGVRGSVVLYRYVEALATVFAPASGGETDSGYGRDFI
jgi:toxin ParE1/3/4